MEIKINREIREYTEAMYFGLSLRQFICCGISPAALPSGFIFCSAPIWGMETDQLGLHAGGGSLCGLIGFVKYHGMTAEKFLWVWIKSEILMPKYLVCQPAESLIL